MPTLEGHIAARLHQALDQRGQFEVFAARRGRAVSGPDLPIIVLTIDDVARIAADAVRLTA